jgi:hypothetical protein
MTFGAAHVVTGHAMVEALVRRIQRHVRFASRLAVGAHDGCLGPDDRVTARVSSGRTGIPLMTGGSFVADLRPVAHLRWFLLDRGARALPTPPPSRDAPVVLEDRACRPRADRTDRSRRSLPRTSSSNEPSFRPNRDQRACPQIVAGLMRGFSNEPPLATRRP